MNCEAYSSFEGVSTDHRIVTAKIRLSLRKNAKRTATTKHYNWALLNNRDIRDKYVLELRNRFETLQEKTEKSTPNDEYENFVNAHLEAAAKCIPTKLKTKYRVPWETLAVRDKRALVKTGGNHTSLFYTVYFIPSAITTRPCTKRFPSFSISTKCSEWQKKSSRWGENARGKLPGVETS